MEHIIIQSEIKDNRELGKGRIFSIIQSTTAIQDKLLITSIHVEEVEIYEEEEEEEEKM